MGSDVTRFSVWNDHARCRLKDGLAGEEIGHQENMLAPQERGGSQTPILLAMFAYMYTVIFNHYTLMYI